MPFEPGHPRWGGRKKGTPNRISLQIRDEVEAHFGKTVAEVLLELSSRTPKERIDVLMFLMPYCYPKLQPIEIPDEQEDVSKEKLKQYLEDHEKLVQITKEMIGE